MLGKKITQWLAILFAISLLSACGGGGNSNSDTPQEIAIEKIKNYANSNGNTSQIPSLQDYLDVGVSGITQENLNDINRIISDLAINEVDTIDEIQTWIDRFNLVIDVPLFISDKNVSVYENDTKAISLLAIGKSALIYRIYDLDSRYFDLNKTTGLVVFKTAPDYERKTSYTFYATAQDEDGNINPQILITINILDVEEIADITYNGLDYNTVVSPYTGRVWLDRNMGAHYLCIALDDTSCFGNYYQWGRGNDGHEVGESSTTNQQESELDATSDSFVITKTDWFISDSNGSDRKKSWNKIDGSDICPPGFRVPILKEIEAETISLQTPIDSTRKAFENFLKLPTAGYRFYMDGVVYNGTTSLWSNTLFGSQSMGIHFLSTRAYTSSSVRSRGLPIRCIKNEIDTIKPVFISPPAFQVHENNISAYFIIVATDSSEFTYGIEGADANSFRINSQTGKVVFLQVPDYEQKNIYNIVAVAIDSSGNKAEQNVTVNILDNTAEVDFAFISPSSVDVIENSTSAIELNTTTETRARYSISGIDASLLEVDVHSGLVTFIDPPDYESGKTTYTFVAIATDATLQEINQTVTIHILDIDEIIEMTHNGVGYGTVISPHTNKTWLDRNLGAVRVCNTLDDVSCYGDYYQWGRGTDGHQSSRSRFTYTQAISIDNPGVKFIIRQIGDSTHSGDWTTDDQNGSQRTQKWSLYDGTSICPSGYRVPTIDELAAETIDVGIRDNIDIFQSFLKIPTAGLRENSFVNVNGREGALYSTSFDLNTTVQPKSLYFTKDYGSTSSYVNIRTTDALYGMNIRCIKN